jgi:hypothetical protein
LYEAVSEKQLEWVELEFSGKLVTRSKRGSLASWDRPTSGNRLGQAPQTGNLIGADGNSLAFTLSDGNSNRLVRVPAK